MKRTQTVERGFTLVELLLVMAIMAVLTTMSLALIRKTNEDATASATEARIRKIESILQAELERFETRRLPISRAMIDLYVQQNPVRNVPPGVQARNLRQRIMMDILNCEWPQANLALNAQGEVTYTERANLASFPSTSFVTWLNTNYPNPQPLAQRLQMGTYRSGAMQSWGAFTASQQNISGEYLYEILRQIDFDGMPAIENLGNAITDSDTDVPNRIGDGRPEIVDAWGEPLAMMLVQVDVERPDPNNLEVFQDKNVDWVKFETPTSITPMGTQVLDPTIPREMQHVRIKVVSARLGLRNGWLN